MLRRCQRYFAMLELLAADDEAPPPMAFADADYAPMPHAAAATLLMMLLFAAEDTLTPCRYDAEARHDLRYMMPAYARRAR